jgi:sarcosine oxidase subunit alpha
MSERLEKLHGEWIDRSRPIHFQFEGESYTGYAGDTIGSALWANGVHVLGRSFKYHRPRGIFGFADIDCNAMVESDSATNMRADLTPIEEGMSVRAVNTLGNLKKDRLRFLDYFGAFTPVGFYYKAFHTPKRLFPFYENQIRKIAGLGKVDTQKPMKSVIKDYGFCDILIIGSGPAGLSAAIETAASGAKVLIIDENPHPGGTLSYRYNNQGREIDLLNQLLEKVKTCKNIQLQSSTLASGYYADHWICLTSKERMTKLRARSVIVASGCYEQPAVFHNNDLPGVMLASAALRLINHYAVKPFRHVVILAANADGYRCALDFHEVGIHVVSLVDLRREGEQSELERQVKGLGITVYRGHFIYEAIAGRMKDSVQGVILRDLDADIIANEGSEIKLSCDGVAMSVGWTPADGILRQGNTRMEYDTGLEQFLPVECANGMFAAGRVNGIYALEDQLEDGRCAGAEATAFIGLTKPGKSKRPPREGSPQSHPHPISDHPKGKNFIDLDEDVQLKDIVNSIKEGYDSPELLKRYSTLGMGPSQGKHSNLLALRMVARMRGETMMGKQITTARPFTSPISMGHLAGRIFTPLRRTSLHDRHEALGAKFMYAGNWLRPEYYTIDGLTRSQCIEAEVQNVRERIGIVDQGTLGKIEISGPDVVTLLERVYTGRFAKLKIGMTRYGLMCDESGVIIDDGVISRLAEDRYYISTTSSGSDAVYQALQRLVIEWKLEVILVNATSTYCAMNLAGPHARKVLQPLTDVNLDQNAFPYLGIREGSVADVPARLSRVGFVGELGYEIHLPADGAIAAWDVIMEAGRDYGLCPFGVEAQRMLRLEKGHIIVSQDTDGLTLPFEAGMNWAVKMDKPFFIGQRSLSIVEKKQRERILVGFSLPENYQSPEPKECNLLIKNGEMKGRITSIGFSPTLGRLIGLAYTDPEDSDVGSILRIKLDDGSFVKANVVKTPFYDPENSRQRVSE